MFWYCRVLSDYQYTININWLCRLANWSFLSWNWIVSERVSWSTLWATFRTNAAKDDHSQSCIGIRSFPLSAPRAVTHNQIGTDHLALSQMLHHSSQRQANTPLDGNLWCWSLTLLWSAIKDDPPRVGDSILSWELVIQLRTVKISLSRLKLITLNYPVPVSYTHLTLPTTPYV